MSNTLKRLGLGAGVVLVLAVLGAGFALGKIGRLIEYGVESQGPKITGTDVSLGNASVSLFSGEGELSRLRIDSPDGFESDEAFDLGRVAVVLDPRSVTGEVIRVRSIVVDAPRLVAEFDATGRSNLKAILDHARAAAQAPRKAQAKDSDAPATKLIVDELRVENAEVRAYAPAFGVDKALKLKPIRLRGLGGRNGSTAAELGSQVLRPVIDAAIAQARDEVLAAQRAQLEQKARDEAKGLLDRVFK